MKRASDQDADSRLREAIGKHLMRCGEDVDASEVTVAVKAGVVTLHGAVPEDRMKHAIEEIVRACASVEAIDNRIRVTYGEHHDVHAERTVDAEETPVVSIGTTTGSGISPKA